MSLESLNSEQETLSRLSCIVYVYNQFFVFILYINISNNKIMAFSYNKAEHIVINSFGGIKMNLQDGLVLDIWAEELDHFIKTANKFEYAFNMKKNIMLKKQL